jgi:hypothetical protein
MCIEEERKGLNHEAAHLLCRLDEIERRLRELWMQQRNQVMGGSNASASK